MSIVNAKAKLTPFMDVFSIDKTEEKRVIRYFKTIIRESKKLSVSDFKDFLTKKLNKFTELTKIFVNIVYLRFLGLSNINLYNGNELEFRSLKVRNFILEVIYK